MAINTMEYAKIYSSELETQIVETSLTGIFEQNIQNYKYSGGKTIMLPVMNLDGLGDYNRGNTDAGYVSGAINLSYTPVEFNYDRSRKIRLDSADIDDTNFALSAASVATVMTNTKIVPEVDAWRFAEIFKGADPANITDYDPAASTIFSKLKDDMLKVQSESGLDGSKLICFMSYDAYSVLTKSTEFQRNFSLQLMSGGDKVATSVSIIDGMQIIKVPKNRFCSAITLNDGTTAGQEAGGYTPVTGAGNIHWIVMPISAVSAINKISGTKIITPDQNQQADAWDIDFRLYGICFISPKHKPLVHICKAADTP